MCSATSKVDNQQKQFILNVLNAFYSDMHRIEKDNYDTQRFSFDGVDRSSTFHTERHCQALYTFLEQQDAFYAAWLKLADVPSKALCIALLRYQLAGHLHVKLPTNSPDYWGIDPNVSAFRISDSPFKEMRGILGPPLHCEVERYGKLIRFEGYPLDCLWRQRVRQYFFDRGGVRIQPEPGDVVIDGGTCMGETVVAFAEAVGPSGSVYGFDVLDTHIAVSQYNCEQNKGLSTCKLIAKGLSDSEFEPIIQRQEQNTILPGLSLIGNEESFPTTTIDVFIARENLQKVDYIKMDIEGSEVKALHGAEQTIRRFKPKLAISIYHLFSHYYEVVLYLDSLGLGYRFYIEHYTIHNEETVLYAIAS